MGEIAHENHKYNQWIKASLKRCRTLIGNCHRADDIDLTRCLAKGKRDQKEEKEVKNEKPFNIKQLTGGGLNRLKTWGDEWEDCDACLQVQHKHML